MDRRRLGFADVLREMSVHGADVLLDSLQSMGCAAKARLACRALRDVLDGSLRELKLRWCTGRQHQLERLKPPSLARWPRCDTVTVCFGTAARDTSSSDDDDRLQNLLTVPDVAAFAVLFFSCQSVTNRRLIRSLRISPDDFSLWASLTGTAMHSLAMLLPELREVHLHVVPGDAMGRKLMYRALECLPHLEMLRIRSVAIAHVGTLAGSLRRLDVVSSSSEEDLTPTGVEGILRLEQLQHLDIHCLLEPGVLLQLLNALPASLRRMYVDSCLVSEARSAPSAKLYFAAGRLTDLEFSHGGYRNGCVRLDFLAELATSVLLPCRALGPRLPSLRLETVTVSGSELLEERELEAVLAFLQRCDHVQLGKLELWPGAGLQAALQVGKLLGAPQRLQLQLPGFRSLHLARPGRLAPGDTSSSSNNYISNNNNNNSNSNSNSSTVLASSGNAADGAAPAPTPAAAAGIAAPGPVCGGTARAAAAARDPAAADPAASTSTSPDTLSPTTASPAATTTTATFASASFLIKSALEQLTVGAEASPASWLLLLRGPFIKRLLRERPSEHFRCWFWTVLRSIFQEAQARGVWLTGLEDFLRVAQPFQAAGSVLLLCDPEPKLRAKVLEAAKKDAAASFASAATATASATASSPPASAPTTSAPSVSAPLPSSPAASAPAASAAAVAAASLAGGPALEVVPVAARWVRELRAGDVPPSAEEMVHVWYLALQQVLQDSWDNVPQYGGGDGDGGGNGDAHAMLIFRQQVEQLLQLGEEIQALPELVRL